MLTRLNNLMQREVEVIVPVWFAILVIVWALFGLFADVHTLVRWLG